MLGYNPVNVYFISGLYMNSAVTKKIDRIDKNILFELQKMVVYPILNFLKE